MPLQAAKLPISHNNVVGKNTVLQLNILETGVLTLVVQNSSPTRLLQNVLVENLQCPARMSDADIRRGCPSRIDDIVVRMWVLSSGKVRYVDDRNCVNICITWA